VSGVVGADGKRAPGVADLDALASALVAVAGQPVAGTGSADLATTSEEQAAPAAVGSAYVPSTSVPAAAPSVPDGLPWRTASPAPSAALLAALPWLSPTPAAAAEERAAVAAVQAELAALPELAVPPACSARWAAALAVEAHGRADVSAPPPRPTRHLSVAPGSSCSALPAADPPTTRITRPIPSTFPSPGRDVDRTAPVRPSRRATNHPGPRPGDGGGRCGPECPGLGSC
jgi:hypothetical protein